MESVQWTDAASAQAYAAGRVKVPSEVAKFIVDFVKDKVGSKAPLTTAVDLGCGSGQSTDIFSPYFKSVIGVDISKQQIEIARNNNTINNVVYEVGTAENIPVAAKSVDLISATTAAHWFDFEGFYEECRRVLTDNGVVALVGTSMGQMLQSIYFQNAHVDVSASKAKKIFELISSANEKFKYSPKVGILEMELFRNIPLPHQCGGRRTKRRNTRRQLNLSGRKSGGL